MFQENDYLNPDDEPYAYVEISSKGCMWAGCLYERKDGGFDLFYDHASSDFKTVDPVKITLLRHRSMNENGLVFIANLAYEKNKKKLLLEYSRRRLLEWIAGTIGI